MEIARTADPFWHLVLIACLIGILSAVVAGGFWELVHFLAARAKAETAEGGRR